MRKMHEETIVGYMSDREREAKKNSYVEFESVDGLKLLVKMRPDSHILLRPYFTTGCLTDIFTEDDVSALVKPFAYRRYVYRGREIRVIEDIECAVKLYREDLWSW